MLCRRRLAIILAGASRPPKLCIADAYSSSQTVPSTIRSICSMQKVRLLPRTSEKYNDCRKRTDFFMVRRQFSVKEMVSSQNDSPLTRNTRVSAQKALFEYLHSTRGLQFEDAEHISHNSPVFLNNLIAKLKNTSDVGQSLRRFLRFHPVNEFEPFFESIGLDPSEVGPLLPQNLMYLADNRVLLENYSVLSKYGVPRGKIGKMFKKGMELFRYSDGVLLSKLQAYESLGLLKNTIIKLVTYCPTLLVGDSGVHVLEKLKDLGLELDHFNGFLPSKGVDSWDRILKMLDLFDRMNFDKKSLGALIKDYPRFLFDKSETVYALVAVLLKRGIRKDGFVTVFMKFPRIFVENFARNLFNSILFLSDIGMEAEVIASIVLSHPQVLSSCHCFTPCFVLRKLSVSDEQLCKMIKDDPSKFSTLVSKKKNSVQYLKKTDNKSHFEKTNFLLKLGFNENSDEMAKALSTFRGRGDQLQDRFDCLVKAGIDYNIVIRMIKTYPQVLNQSVDVIKKKINFLLNDVGYSLEEATKFPGFLCYTVEKIKMRCSMHKWIVQNRDYLSAKRSRSMHSSGAALSSILACSDARFVKYVVNLHPEGPKEWERLKRSVLPR